MRTANRIGLFRGEGFQAFCSVLLSAHDPAFQAVDGTGGDLGNDGFAVTGDAVYQAYAPDSRRISKVREKIDDSVKKAALLCGRAFPGLRRFVFLTPFDLTPEQHQHLRTAGQGAGLVAESWGESKLLALLAQHPETKNEFPEILLPDILEEIRKLRVVGVEAEVPELPRIDVLQRSVEHPDANHSAYSYFTLHVASPGLALPSIEPSDEDVLLEAVRERFREDRSARLETRDHVRVLIERGMPELRFHRRWGRWTGGVLAMAATLPDLSRPGCYSVADMAIDVTRALRLAAYLGTKGTARVRFSYDPYRLEVKFDPSDVRARERPGAALAGIHAVERPVLTETRESTWEGEYDINALAAEAHTLAAALIVPAVRYFHLARIDTKAVSESIPTLIAAHVEALAL
jgi:hypothetical protein